jgi:hypothetical protein
VVLDGFLAGNCYVSPVMLDPQTVLPSVPAFQATARKKMATSTGNSTDSQTTLITTVGRSKTHIPMLTVT